MERRAVPRNPQLPLQIEQPNGPGPGRGDPPRPPRARGGRGGGDEPPPPIEDTSLAEEAQKKYLNYALSVITSRALPDVRDGLKPVQRRILYTMQHDLHLGADAKPKKSARVVGDVMGKYHPHGDMAIYDAMVRLAQDWVLRAPLVYGHGNFGSIDGDGAAAHRYTEARLMPVAGELLGELGKKTVDWRPNYDGTQSEPIVLPARFPNILVNGSQGIAVGMATSIPPHNLGEVIDACLAMIDSDDLTTFRLLTHIKGPDFPTGGQLHVTKRELQDVYENGQGSLKLRGEWRAELDGRVPQVIVTSIPYGVEKRSIVEKIAEVIISKKLPALVDVRDESTAEVRIVLELRKGADAQLVMAYLFKNTPMSVNVQVNLTCLCPTDNPEIAAPRRLSLREILSEFLDFRYTTVTRRLEFELGELKRKIHVLEGFETVFDALDELIKIIRKSEGKDDAAKKIIARFDLTDEQTEAILELKLYRLARLEILLIRKDLDEKRTEAKRLEGLLKSESKRWALVRGELEEVKEKYADKRRTKIIGVSDEPEFQEEDFIVAEDANVVLSAQGWVKRVRELRDPTQTRLREGDSVLAAVAGSTRASVAFFSNLGVCYVSRIHDVPPSTGYGDPVQKLFKLGDGERIVAMLSFDPRALAVPAATEGAVEPEPPLCLAVTRGGLGFRFSLRPHRDPSTRAGRKFAKLNQGDEVLAVVPTNGSDSVLCAASDGHVLGVKLEEISILSGVGKGAMVMKVSEGERLVGAVLALGPRDDITIETEKGRTLSYTLRDVAGSRAARGDLKSKRDRFVRVVLPPPVVTPLEVT
jgi:DNA gyrase subunit A